MATGPARGDAPFISGVAFEEARIRAASLYCSDGRYGEQFDDFLHHALHLPRYDRLAVPGGPACLTGRLDVFWEGHSAQQQLDFLAAVHGLERLVLIQHQGCAFYRQWLKVRDEALEARQVEDLHKAAELMRRRHPELRVDAFFARRLEDEVRFEPVALPAADGALAQGLTSTQST
ncbi:MAG TPA: hypothetical protein VHL80_17745 [Polyangia bacterium]|nr:hypothetical protein [Polyangia bacterium]